MKVSFSGIYDVRFPYGTKDEFIKQKAQETKAYMIEQGYINPGHFEPIHIDIKDSFNLQKTDKKLDDKGIRISSGVDNPWILCDIFEHIDKSLGQQYVDNSKVELVFDKQA